MNCKITVTPDFLRELKRLSKRYRSLKTDVKDLGNELAKNPLLGTDLGHRLRKVRMSITSKGKGKSGGARVITYTVVLAQVEAEIKLIPYTTSRSVKTFPMPNCLTYFAVTVSSD